MQPAKLHALMSTTLFAAVFFALVLRHEANRLKPEDLFAGGRAAQFVKMEFDGQRRHVTVTNQAILNGIEFGFKHREKNNRGAGLTYHAKILLKNKEKVAITVFVFVEGDGFSVAIPRSSLLDQDPYYWDVNLPPEAASEFSKVFQALTNDIFIGKSAVF